MKRTIIRGTRIEREPYIPAVVSQTLPIPASQASEHLRYTIDEYDEAGSLLEVLGRLYDLDAALAAFDACVKKYPDKLIFLRHGAMVVRRSDEPKD